MPLEYYIGALIAVTLLVLLAQLFRRSPARKHDMRKSSDSERVAKQLSRIADALEALVVHMGPSTPRVARPLPSNEASEPIGPNQVHREASPATVEQSPDILKKPSDSGEAVPEQTAQQTPHHVNLSMFGR